MLEGQNEGNGGKMEKKNADESLNLETFWKRK